MNSVKDKIEEHIHDSWKELFYDKFSNVRMKLLEKVIESDKEESNVFPSKFEDIFKIFKVPIDKISCCIVGQDPYARAGQAIGRSFAVSEKTPVPLSLRVMFKEIERTYGHVYTDRTLQHWEDQGVFLLNMALTVRQERSGSHLPYWEFFTEDVVRILNDRDIPFLLMGAFAKKLQVKTAVKTLHPAVEGYGKLKFVGNDAFTELNIWLNDKIIW